MKQIIFFLLISVSLAAQVQEWRYIYHVDTSGHRSSEYNLMLIPGEPMKLIVVDSYLVDPEKLTFQAMGGGESYVIQPQQSGAYKCGQIEGSCATTWDLERQAAYDAFFSDAPATKPVKRGLWDIDFRSYKVTVPLLFASGIWDGLNEVLHTHYPRFQARFPNANPGWWNPAISWENKWKIDADGSVMTGFDRFPGSSTVFVFVTDGYHATRAADHLFLYAGIALNIGERKRWTHYLVDVGLHSLARSIGFNAVYHIAF